MHIGPQNEAPVLQPRTVGLTDITQQERLHSVEKIVPAILCDVSQPWRDQFSFATQTGNAADQRLSLRERAEGSMQPWGVLSYHTLTDT